MQTKQRNKLNFKGQNIYIGIDVHKKSWSVTILSEITLFMRLDSVAFGFMMN